MAKERFHVYMNLDVVNNSSNKPKRLVFNMTRTIPFLTNAEDYFLTVARFNLQTSNSLPVFIPDILTGQDSVDLTVYTITLSVVQNRQTISQTVPVIYTTSDTSQPIPSPPRTAADKTTSYYWVYNVGDWVAMLNASLNNATILLNTAIADVGAYVTAPYIQYDVTTGLFTLFVDQNAQATISFKVYFNSSLYNVLPFPSVYQQIPSASSTDYYYCINIPNSLGNESTALVAGTSKNFLSVTTEFSPLSIMCPIRSIYFATNLLPIEPMLTQPPKVLSDNSLSGSSSGDPGITNILTDFEIAVTPTNNYNGEISYLPSSEYRWVDMTQGLNLNKLDLSAYWKDKYGNSYPIYLPVNCAADIKLLFRSKRFYLGYNY